MLVSRQQGEPSTTGLTGQTWNKPACYSTGKESFRWSGWATLSFDGTRPPKTKQNKTKPKNLRKGWLPMMLCASNAVVCSLGPNERSDGSVCGHTYVGNHCHPARPLCSCRMGTFVWRWNSFYACQWMTVKAEKAWRKQAHLSSSCSKV